MTELPAEIREAVRKPLSKSLRFEVFKRDGFACAYCGAHPPAVTLEVDHIHPVSQGGANDIDNLVTACVACNRGKAARLLADVPRSLRDRASDIADREEQIAGYEAVMRAKRERVDQEVNEIMYYLLGSYPHYNETPADRRSIARFIEALGFGETEQSVIRAIEKYPNFENEIAAFRYFCGICWGKIRDAGGRQ